MPRRVCDVMTTEVVSASPETPYKELVRLLVDHKISALPVVDDRHHAVGVVSEADLLLKEELPPQARKAPLLARRRWRTERAKARGVTAADVMTTPVVTIGEQATVAEAARRLHAAGVKRLPVDDVVGRLVGIVSRSDLLKVFLRPDQEIRREVVEEVIRHDMLMGTDRFHVVVTDGVVVLEGVCERRSLIPILVRAVYGVDGVVRVQNRLGFDVDDTTRLAPVPPWGVPA
jgi:CBS-domain-containing membrane protein